MDAADPSDAGDAADAGDAGGDTFHAGMSRLGTAGKLSVVLDAVDPAPPQRDVNTWNVHVRDTADAGVSGCDVAVSLYMPAHMHGSSVVPKVAEIPNDAGGYTVSDLYFFMPGLWEVTFDLTCAEVTDRVVYSFWIAR